MFPPAKLSLHMIHKFVYINIFTLSGCGQLWAIDGNWKLHYPICMYDVPKTADCFSNNLSYVRTCPNAPEYGGAFCLEHMEVMKNSGVPIKLKEYLEFLKQGTVTVQDTSKSMQSAAKCQGMCMLF